jgi:uncharacterized protein YgfB (UPF0149 family)
MLLTSLTIPLMLDNAPMSSAPLPDFERTLTVNREAIDAPALAECHGVACGLLCRLPAASLDEFLDLLGALELVRGPAASLRLSLDELLNASREQLADVDMGLELWLPTDDEMLEDRTMSLAHWCSGFLAALGSGGEAGLRALSEDAEEALSDLQQIAKADVTDASESEEDEAAFAEIVEYLRVVVLMIREDLRGPGDGDAIH